MRYFCVPSTWNVLIFTPTKNYLKRANTGATNIVQTPPVLQKNSTILRTIQLAPTSLFLNGPWPVVALRAVPN